MLTFENVSKWLKEIDDNLNRPQMVLFGNKIDLEEEQRQIKKEEAEQFAQENNLIYFETSAKTKQGIVEGFDYLINKHSVYYF